ncbi:MAG: hypothetical protein PHW63_05080 [Alphaproteobacteria bacterium]|nr:hypothetical protein [Alphaproteobacteria bacterium]
MRRTYTKQPKAVVYKNCVQKAATLVVQETVNAWFRQNEGFQGEAKAICNVVSSALKTVQVSPEEAIKPTSVRAISVTSILKDIKDKESRERAERVVGYHQTMTNNLLQGFETLKM